jgi:hypothetical protein
LVNSICDRALLTGFIREEKIISEEIIDEVAQELELNENPSTLVTQMPGTQEI